jgi:hypothetical protein
VREWDSSRIRRNPSLAINLTLFLVPVKQPNCDKQKSALGVSSSLWPSSSTLWKFFLASQILGNCPHQDRQWPPVTKHRRHCHVYSFDHTAPFCLVDKKIAILVIRYEEIYIKKWSQRVTRGVRIVSPLLNKEFDKVTFMQSPEGDTHISHRDIWGKKVQSRRKASAKTLR